MIIVAQANRSVGLCLMKWRCEYRMFGDSYNAGNSVLASDIRGYDVETDEQLIVGLCTVCVMIRGRIQAHLSWLWP